MSLVEQTQIPVFIATLFFFLLFGRNSITRNFYIFWQIVIYVPFNEPFKIICES